MPPSDSPSAEPQRDLGRRLRELREAAKLTQEELGVRAGFTGKYVSEIERGLRDPPLSTINALATAADGSLDMVLKKNQPEKMILFHRVPDLPSEILDLARDINALPPSKRRHVLRIVKSLVKLAWTPTGDEASSSD